MNTIDSRNQKIAELEQNNLNIKNSIKSLNKLDIIDLNPDDIEESIKFIQSKITSDNQKIIELRTQVQNLNNISKNYNQIVENHNDQKNELERLNTVDEKLQIAYNNVEILEKTISSQNDRLILLKKKIDDSEIENNKLKVETEKLDLRNKSLYIANKSLESEVSQKNKRIDYLSDIAKKLPTHDEMARFTYHSQKDVCVGGSDFKGDYLISDVCRYISKNDENISQYSRIGYRSKDIILSNISNEINTIDHIIVDGGRVQNDECFSSKLDHDFYRGAVSAFTLYSSYVNILKGSDSDTNRYLIPSFIYDKISMKDLYENYSGNINLNLNDILGPKIRISILEFSKLLVDYKDKYLKLKDFAFKNAKLDDLYSINFESLSDNERNLLANAFRKEGRVFRNECFERRVVVDFSVGGRNHSWSFFPEPYLYSFWLRRDLDGSIGDMDKAVRTAISVLK